MNIFKLFMDWLPLVIVALFGYMAFQGSKIEGDVSIADTTSIFVMGMSLIIIILSLVWIDISYRIKDLKRGD